MSSHQDFEKELKSFTEKMNKLQREKIEIEVKKENALKRIKEIEQDCLDKGIDISDLSAQIEDMKLEMQKSISLLKEKFKEFAQVNHNQKPYEKVKSSSEDVPF